RSREARRSSFLSLMFASRPRLAPARPPATQWIPCAWPLRGSYVAGPAARRACAVSPPRIGARDSCEARVCLRESAAGQKSWRVLQESSLKLPPPINETVVGEDTLKSLLLDRAGLDELEQTSFVLGSSGLKSDRGEVVSAENPGG